MVSMKRGEVWWVNFDPAIGEEIKKKRPAVIISNDYSNAYTKRVQVVPFTSNVSKVYPSEVLVSVANRASKAMADQMMTVSKLRLSEKIADIKVEDMQKIEAVVCLQLGIKG